MSDSVSFGDVLQPSTLKFRNKSILQRAFCLIGYGILQSELMLRERHVLFGMTTI